MNNAKRNILIVSGLFVISLFVLRFFSFIQNTDSIVYSPEPYFDMGRIPVKNGMCANEHDFILNNDTGKSVKIKKIQISCDCVKILKVPSEIEAQAMGVVKIQMVLHPEKIDFRTVSILIELDSEVTPFVKLKVSGAPQILPKMENNSFNFGEISLGHQKTISTSVLIPSNLPSSGKILSVPSSSSNELVILFQEIKIKDTSQHSFGREHFIPRFTLSVTVTPRTIGRRKKTIPIKLQSGDVLYLNIQYESVLPNRFVPDIFFLSEILTDESYSFKVKFIPDLFDAPMKFYTDCSSIEISTHEIVENEHILNLAVSNNLKNEQNLQREFFLYVKTKMGKIIKMPLIYQKISNKQLS